MPQAERAHKDDGCESSLRVQSFDESPDITIFTVWRAFALPSTTKCRASRATDVGSTHTMLGITADVDRSATEKDVSASDNHLKAPLANYITSPQDPIAPSPVNSDVTNFEDVDEEVEEEGTEPSSMTEVPFSPNATQGTEVTSPRREGIHHIATPLRVCVIFELLISFRMTY